MRTLILALLRVYRRWISPLLGPGKCRFEPTCSQYAVEAVELHGVLRGLGLAIRRLLRCHPWSRRWGPDPVPPVSRPSDPPESIR